jgi:hypothetical protein
MFADEALRLASEALWAAQMAEAVEGDARAALALLVAEAEARAAWAVWRADEPLIGEPGWPDHLAALRTRIDVLTLEPSISIDADGQPHIAEDFGAPTPLVLEAEPIIPLNLLNFVFEMLYLRCNKSLEMLYLTCNISVPAKGSA